jgi:hypothetical protein
MISIKIKQISLRDKEKTQALVNPEAGNDS